jgi:adenine-specific DNA methylase
VTSATPLDEEAPIDTFPDVRARMIDHWFPCAAVDAAAASPAGSGRSEKALFPWFASRPIAQARAVVLTSLLPNEEKLHPLVEAAIVGTDPEALDKLAAAVHENYGQRQPVVVDMFSGRAIIPLEAARVGARAVGTDLSPVATLAGRLLADWPLRDWDHEPALPFTGSGPDQLDVFPQPRLLQDARSIHQEIGRRLAAALRSFYPAADNGKQPWGTCGLSQCLATSATNASRFSAA